MNRKMFLAGTALAALATAGAAAGSAPATFARTGNVRPAPPSTTVLYSQNSNFEIYSIVSQNFTSGSLGTTYNAAAADDFVVPAGKKWTIDGLDVAGLYFNGQGRATSEIVTFYKNSNGRPGAVIGSPQTLHCTDSAGSFSCKLNKVRLKGSGKKGTDYWVSIVANCSFAGGCGEWGWTQTVTHTNPGQWENPGGGDGTSCSTWTETSKCILQQGVVDDYAFDLRGKD
jgi:hypothetical protein